MFSFCWLTPYPTLNYNLVYCLFPLHSLFRLIRDLMTVCWGRIKYPVHAVRDTYLTSGSSPMDAVIFNSFDLTFHSLIWDFTRCVLWLPPTSLFIGTPSLKRVSPKAEEFFLPMRHTIPRQTPSRYFEVSGILLLLLLLLLFLYLRLTLQ